jgi:peptidoglycan/LPS O-acetylase OafA/YrhL
VGYFRLFLAIAVVADHISPVDGVGGISVGAFYILSGYLITAVLQSHYKQRIGAFWANRLLRLYPTYLFIWLLSVAYIAQYGSSLRIGLDNLFPSVLMIDRYDPHNPTYSPVSVGWSITVELIFYGLMSLGLSATAKRTALWLIGSLAMFVLCDFSLFQPEYFTPPFASLFFAVGAACYWMGLKLQPDRGLSALAGALSYPVYLSHYLIGSIVSTWTVLSVSWPLFWLSLPLTLIFSWALIRLEEKFINPLRSRLRNA